MGGAVPAPKGRFEKGAVASLPALEPLASLDLSGRASMCTGVPKSCLPFAEDWLRSGVLVLRSASRSFLSWILPLIQPMGPFLSLSLSENTPESLAPPCWPAVCVGVGVMLGSVAVLPSGTGSWKLRRGCEADALLLPMVERDMACSLGLIIPSGPPGGGGEVGGSILFCVRENLQRCLRLSLCSNSAPGVGMSSPTISASLWSVTSVWLLNECDGEIVGLRVASVGVR